MFCVGNRVMERRDEILGQSDGGLLGGEKLIESSSVFVHHRFWGRCKNIKTKLKANWCGKGCNIGDKQLATTQDLGKVVSRE